ncbi:MAG TPA: hypothetical protein VFD91_01560 [Mariniphaga sp.]|nr:hypothetical protein [Mariniphaga sp.]
MYKSFLLLSLIAIIFTSCSSGKKAFQQGDYFIAVSKAVDRLRSSPDNKKAASVLHEAYQYALEWSQEEIDLVEASNSPYKWEHVMNMMEKVNNMSAEIRGVPAARQIIRSPKVYTAELTSVYEKAAEERYLAGQEELNRNSREAARIAFDHFYAADQYMPGYKQVRELMDAAKDLATVKVVLEAIPETGQKYKLSSQFFFNQIFSYLNSKYDSRSFINFYSSIQARNAGINYPDYIINMEFFDFSIGNLTHTEKEENLKKQVKVETKDTTKIVYKTYAAKFKTFTDQVHSGGSLRVMISEAQSDKMLVDEIIPGSFTWINQYALHVGDIEALDKKQVELTKMKALPLPPEQDLFIEFTKPVYDQVVARLNRFFQPYN